MNDFNARIQALGPRYSPLASLARNNEGKPLFGRDGDETPGEVFVYDARRKAIVVSRPVEALATATRATRCVQSRYTGDDRIRVVRDRATGKLGIQAA